MAKRECGGGGLNLVAKMIDGEWQQMSAEQKAIYKQMADDFNLKNKKAVEIKKGDNIMDTAIVVDGENGGGGGGDAGFKKVSQEVIAHYSKGPTPLIESRKILNALFIQNDPAKVPILILNFSTYGEDYHWENLLVAEVGLCVFTLSEGILENFAALVDPGANFHKRMKNGVRDSSKKLAVPLPGFDKRAQNYGPILERIFQIGKMYSSSYGRVTFHCLLKDIVLTEMCLKWVMWAAGIYAHNLQATYDFILIPLDDMINVMAMPLKGKLRANEVSVSYKEPVDVTSPRIPTQMEVALAVMESETERYMIFPEGFPTIEEGLFLDPKHVTDLLDVDNYAFREELACLYHAVRRDGVNYCPLNIANRYAFNLLHVLIHPFNVTPIAGRHYPTILHDNGEERSRRREMLRKWGIFDTTEIGLIEAENDQELQLSALPPLIQVQEQFKGINLGQQSGPRKYGRGVLEDHRGGNYAN